MRIDELRLECHRSLTKFHLNGFVYMSPTMTTFSHRLLCNEFQLFGTCWRVSLVLPADGATSENRLEFAILIKLNSINSINDNEIGHDRIESILLKVVFLSSPICRYPLELVFTITHRLMRVAWHYNPRMCLGYCHIIANQFVCCRVSCEQTFAYEHLTAITSLCFLLSVGHRDAATVRKAWRCPRMYVCAKMARFASR